MTVAYRISSRGFIMHILMRTNLLFTDHFKQSIAPVLMSSADVRQDKHLFRYFVWPQFIQFCFHRIICKYELSYLIQSNPLKLTFGVWRMFFSLY